MANITQTSVDPAIPEFWLALALGYLKANLMMARLVRRDGDSVVAEHGDTINITKRGGLTVRDKVEDTDVTADAPSNTKIAVVLDQHKYVSWHLEDTASAKAIDAAVDYVQDAAAGLAEAIETELLKLHANIANDVGQAGKALGFAELMAARKQLNDQKCPMMGRKLIVSSKDEISLLDTDRIIESNKNGGDGSVLEEAMLGRILGFDTYMSQLVEVTSGTPDTTHNIAFHGDAFMLATRPLALPEPGSGAIGQILVDPDTNIAMRYTRQWDARQLKTQHVLDVLFGVKAVDEDRLAVEVKS
jgi:hypothetical protein